MTDATGMTTTGRQGGPVVLSGDAVRGRTLGREFAVGGACLAAYAAATRDTRPDRVSGEVGSPAFAFVPLTELLFDVVAAVAGTRNPPGLVHTHQEFAYRGPIVAGDRLLVRGRVTSLREGPFGGVLTMAADTAREDGTPVNHQVVTTLVVGSACVNPIEDPLASSAAAAATSAAGASDVVVRPSGGSLPISVDRDHPARYADASGDRNPIHLDAAFARANGFPGAIVHGMCTLALACHALEARLAPTGEPAALGVEFTRPVLAGDRLTVRWEPGEQHQCRFDVVNRRRRTVLRGGRLAWLPSRGHAPSGPVP